jgi:cyclopropane-fatty-acyl-phospholipid synthase
MTVESVTAVRRGPVVPEAYPTRVRATIARSLFERTVRRLPLRVERRNGGVINPGPPGAPVMIIERDAFWQRLGRDGKIGFGEAYMAGDWTASDIAAVFKVFAESLTTLIPQPLQRLRRLYEPSLGLQGKNTVDRAVENIVHHYDLSNDLFALFLDETMTYSCAVFEAGDSLAQAQARKYERLCAMLELTADDHLLEIGTGWGGMAMHAASSRGCRVTSVTVSPSQRALAIERIAAAGLEDRVSVLERDYRAVEGSYSKIVSVEMFEAVGESYWPTFFMTCDRLLAPAGAMAMQTITMPHSRFLATRRQFGWIHKYIFPGGLIPSMEAIGGALAAGSALRVQRHDDIGHHYTRTLAEWRARFVANESRVAALGFTHEFRRMWEFYLAYCEAGFATEVLGDAQILLSRASR